MKEIRSTCKRVGIDIVRKQNKWGVDEYIENGRVEVLHISLPEWVRGNADTPKGKHGHDYRIDSMRYNQVINN